MGTNLAGKIVIAIVAAASGFVASYFLQLKEIEVAVDSLSQELRIMACQQTPLLAADAGPMNSPRLLFEDANLCEWRFCTTGVTPDSPVQGDSTNMYVLLQKRQEWGQQPEEVPFKECRHYFATGVKLYTNTTTDRQKVRFEYIRLGTGPSR